MANTLTVDSLVDGTNLGVAQVTIEYVDTTDGEVVVLDSSALTGGTPIKSITHVEAVAEGCTAKLEFKQTSKKMICLIPEGDSVQNFSKNRIKNPEGAGTTGDVVCTTSGLSVAGDKLVMVIKYRK